jgi:hypothetical protein
MDEFSTRNIKAGDLVRINMEPKVIYGGLWKVDAIEDEELYSSTIRGPQPVVACFNMDEFGASKHTFIRVPINVIVPTGEVR